LFKKKVKSSPELTVKFRAVDSYAFNVAIPPTPATDHIPKWWKDISPFTSEQIMSDPSGIGQYSHVTAKKCFPMLDAMTAGYMIPLWADVEVHYPDEDSVHPVVSWLTDRTVIDAWKVEFTQGMEHPEDCVPIAFKFMNQYVVETPPGWSSLFIHPVGFPNLPFRSIGGVVDTDILKTDINQPLWIKKGFTGIIPKGTPIAQVIPFQRMDWTHTVDEKAPNEHYYDYQRDAKTKAVGAYSLYQRVKKNFK
jgi:hypothetical protein